MPEVKRTTYEIQGIDRAVFVAGHPRSGTSATCQLVETDPEVTFLKNTSPDNNNERGYYEYRPLLQWSLGVQQSERGEWHTDDLESVISTIEGIDPEVIGAKQLHTGSLFYWGNAASEESDPIVEDFRVVAIFRDPSAAYSSMWNKRLLNFPTAWWKLYNFLLAYYDKNPDEVAFVKHSRLMNRPQQVAEMLSRELDLDVDPGVIDPNLQTTRDPAVESGSLAKRIYEKLCKLEEAQYP